jgi:hypothetical protein
MPPASAMSWWSALTKPNYHHSCAGPSLWQPLEAPRQQHHSPALRLRVDTAFLPVLVLMESVMRQSHPSRMQADNRFAQCHGVVTANDELNGARSIIAVRKEVDAMGGQVIATRGGMIHLVLQLCRQFEDAFGKAIDGGKGGVSL